MIRGLLRIIIYFGALILPIALVVPTRNLLVSNGNKMGLPPVFDYFLAALCLFLAYLAIIGIWSWLRAIATGNIRWPNMVLAWLESQIPAKYKPAPLDGLKRRLRKRG